MAHVAEDSGQLSATMVALAPGYRTKLAGNALVCYGWQKHKLLSQYFDGSDASGADPGLAFA